MSWTQALGENGRSDFSAQYTAENNYPPAGRLDPVDIPEASRTWRVEGSYTTAFGDRSTLQTGLRYRERQSASSVVEGGTDPLFDSPGRCRASTCSAAAASGCGRRCWSSTASTPRSRDGSLALTPQGGVVLQLGQHWQIEASASRRVYQTEDCSEPGLPPDALPRSPTSASRAASPATSSAAGAADRRGRHCSPSAPSTARSARPCASTSATTSSTASESLYLVRGDELPELQFGVQRQVTPQVLATLESSVASGGGGIFYAADRQPYENQVQLHGDLARHPVPEHLDRRLPGLPRLAQELEPVGAAAARAGRRRSSSSGCS